MQGKKSSTLRQTFVLELTFVVNLVVVGDAFILTKARKACPTIIKYFLSPLKERTDMDLVSLQAAEVEKEREGER
jgi:hypothetical protein